MLEVYIVEQKRNPIFLFSDTIPPNVKPKSGNQHIFCYVTDSGYRRLLFLKLFDVLTSELSNFCYVKLDNMDRFKELYKILKDEYNIKPHEVVENNSHTRDISDPPLVEVETTEEYFFTYIEKVFK